MRGRPAAVLALSLIAAGRPAGAETALTREDGRWEVRSVRSVRDVLGSVAAPAGGLGRFGGRRDAAAGATGFFRVERLGGRWWLVDPEGFLFLSVGVCTVNPGSLGEGVVRRRFGDRPGWTAATAALLRENGFNTLGSWSADRLFREGERPLPYAPQWNFVRSYREVRRAAYGKGCSPRECIPLFDPEFEGFCDAHARALDATRDDPWLLGHFSDNELPFPPDALDVYLGLPPSDPGRAAARRWWEERSSGNPRRSVGEGDRRAFLELLARRYYEVVGGAIRRRGPNHLYLGSRRNGTAVAEPVLRGAESVDVVSVNYYHAWTPDPERTADWIRWSGRPYLASEWYAEVDEQGAGGAGAGFRVAGLAQEQF